MLKPALLYKDIILTKFTELLYTEDYYFYMGYDCGTRLPDLQSEEGTYHYAFVDDNDNVIGFLTYQIYTTTDTVHNFGLISFDKGNPLVGRDLFKKLKELINQHHKVEWCVVDGNPVKKHYDKFCKEHNGYIHHFHDTGRDLNGNLVDSYSYEIINDKR